MDETRAKRLSIRFRRYNRDILDLDFGPGKKKKKLKHTREEKDRGDDEHVDGEGEHRRDERASARGSASASAISRRCPCSDRPNRCRVPPDDSPFLRLISVLPGDGDGCCCVLFVPNR